MIIETILTGAIRSGTSLLLAAQGEVLAERSGVVNLGTEGSMLAGALVGFAVAAVTRNPYAAILPAGAAGALLALLHAYLVIDRRANQLASGLAVMILGEGITAFLGRTMVDRQTVGLHPVAVPLLAQIPFVGTVLFRYDALTYLSFLLAPALWWLLFRTRWGLLLRATGERREVVLASGYRPERIQYAATLAGGFLAGLGGAQLSIGYTQSWIENMTNGRGFVAVALAIFSGWSPLRAVLGAYLFGGALALELLLQATGVAFSPFLLSMAPYVLTVLALAAAGRRRDNMPEGLRAVFEGTAVWRGAAAPGSGVASPTKGEIAG